MYLDVNTDTAWHHVMWHSDLWHAAWNTVSHCVSHCKIQPSVTHSAIQNYRKCFWYYHFTLYEYTQLGLWDFFCSSSLGNPKSPNCIKYPQLRISFLKLWIFSISCLLPCSAVLCSAVNCSALQFTAVHCSKVQCCVERCKVIFCNIL